MNSKDLDELRRQLKEIDEVSRLIGKLREAGIKKREFDLKSPWERRLPSGGL